MTDRGLAESRAQAQVMIMAGQVRVNDQVTLKPATGVQPNAVLTVDSGPRFISRGGEKLEAALEAFGIDVAGLICVDVGASTGGFTDCMLQHGAEKVYAIDVGKGILHWKLRNHPKVVVMEQTNARYVESLPEPVDFVTIDASFISLKILLPMAKKWLAPLRLPPFSEKMGGEKEGGGEGHSSHLRSKWGETEGGLVVLIKPQFEAGRKDVSRGGGVIRDPHIHRQVLLDVLAFAQNEGFGVKGLIRSPILGPKGNVEFLAWLSLDSNGQPVETLVEQIIPKDDEDEMP